MVTFARAEAFGQAEPGRKGRLHSTPDAKCRPGECFSVLFSRFGGLLQAETLTRHAVTQQSIQYLMTTLSGVTRQMMTASSRGVIDGHPRTIPDVRMKSVGNTVLSLIYSSSFFRINSDAMTLG